MNEKKWPNFFIVGAPRAGTTALYNYLNVIPEIYMSPVKDPGYFIPNDFRGFTEQTYIELFKNVKNEIAIGEASAGYLANSEAPKRIKEKSPSAKIIITLRDPVGRTFSHYLNWKRTGKIKISFEKVVEKFLDKNKNDEQLERLIYVSMYYEQVKRYLEIFGKENVKILIFEETVKDIKNTIKKIFEFLEVQAEPPENIEEQHSAAYSEPLGSIGTSIAQNKTISKIIKKILPGTKQEQLLRTLLNKKGEKPELLDTTKKKLQSVFHDDVKKLEKLLGRSLPWPTAKEEN